MTTPRWEIVIDLRWQEELGIGQGLLEGLSPAGGDNLDTSIVSVAEIISY